ncbi:(Fe-S)-binding protein [Silvibacterium dinghuense]|uniref:(Fe-S)-binding protein n=1 Tax=Silvibacterium dinghuense TaxID=1560006 RepID=A0A4Q1SIU0_9BACT|nr:(Fe-S)-binding protein [Silvibacterium dinghuense]RXS97327.1 (Fe-S)-binding protein [Silvibacterium dinghuense]GGG98084.1 iron-sulfur-binding protein [Silvibacterium dinghuense]
MLPLGQRYAFAVFAFITLVAGARGFYGVYRRIRRGRAEVEPHGDDLPRRVIYALMTTLTQSRTFRRRPWVSFFHAFIFYGFVFYILVNFVDAIEGFVPLRISSASAWGAAYQLFADVLSALVLVGVVALVARRFLLPARRDFLFNDQTLLQNDVRKGKIARDSLIVSAFILFHVGSRAMGAGARLAVDGPDPWEPFASMIAGLIPAQSAEAWREFGYWGALGSVLVFLAYFPYSKHLHLFLAPVNSLLKREAGSGVLPPVEVNLEAEEGFQIGAERLEELGWPRLLDAYACIQCNRCQQACPATATGKSLSPSAIEINKRMELNRLAGTGFDKGEASPRTLLEFALTPEAAWACTTCGACVAVCPVEDSPMLDIVEVRRQQVMMAGEFPAQLQTAFRGMERTQNPWGINHEQRMQWAEGLRVPTVEENPEAEVLYWVGCAASYDPQAQRTARALVKLMGEAGVSFAVLGKRECCTGDSARRAGNEVLYRSLAEKNVATLNNFRSKTIVASCPHCLNAIGHEYRQLGGEYQTVHHSELLASLVAQGRLKPQATGVDIAYHDPCYLGRHNGVYEAPREVLHQIGKVAEMPRARENSFCCGAGGAQFWKEEEPGTERIATNRMREAKETLAGSPGGVLAVGCPFCKSMLSSAPGGAETVVVKDIAELLLEAVEKGSGMIAAVPAAVEDAAVVPAPAVVAVVEEAAAVPASFVAIEEPKPVEMAAPRKKWSPAGKPSPPVDEARTAASAGTTAAPTVAEPEVPVAPRKKWNPATAREVEKPAVESSVDASKGAVTESSTGTAQETSSATEALSPAAAPRKKWQSKSGKSLN